MVFPILLLLIVLARGVPVDKMFRPLPLLQVEYRGGCKDSGRVSTLPARNRSDFLGQECRRDYQADYKEFRIRSRAHSSSETTRILSASDAPVVIELGTSGMGTLL